MYGRIRQGRRRSILFSSRLAVTMGLPRQTVVLLQSARQLLETLPADAVLLVTDTDLDWDEVREHLNDYRLLVAAQDSALTTKIKEYPGLTVLDIDPGPTPTQERMSL